MPAQVAKALCWPPLTELELAGSEPAAANCSNKRVAWRFRMRLFVARQAETTLNEAGSATLQARVTGSSPVGSTLVRWAERKPGGGVGQQPGHLCGATAAPLSSVDGACRAQLQSIVASTGARPVSRPPAMHALLAVAHSLLPSGTWVLRDPLRRNRPAVMADPSVASGRP
jgi:hypothetical protein